MVLSSNQFYQKHAKRYSQVVHEYIQSAFTNISHPLLADELNIMRRLKELIPPESRGLDAGCGAGARDLFMYYLDGYDVSGFDAVDENISIAKLQHPEIADRVAVGNLNSPIPHPDSDFNFLTCNAVIQHIERDVVMGLVLPEFVRVLKPDGILQLQFKVGTGNIEIYDKDYDEHRNFRLFSSDEIVARLEELGMELIPEEDGKLGGIMFFTDTKPVEHCLVFARRKANGAN